MDESPRKPHLALTAKLAKRVDALRVDAPWRVQLAELVTRFTQGGVARMLGTSAGNVNRWCRGQA